MEPLGLGLLLAPELVRQTLRGCRSDAPPARRRDPGGRRLRRLIARR